MLRRLVENTGLPFCDTQMGKGVVDSSALSPGSAMPLPDDQGPEVMGVADRCCDHGRESV